MDLSDENMNSSRLRIMLPGLPLMEDMTHLSQNLSVALFECHDANDEGDRVAKLHNAHFKTRGVKREPQYSLLG